MGSRERNCEKGKQPKVIRLIERDRPLVTVPPLNVPFVKAPAVKASAQSEKTASTKSIPSLMKVTPSVKESIPSLMNVHSSAMAQPWLERHVPIYFIFIF